MIEDSAKRAKRIQDITFILKDLLKVIKVVYMYPEDNPLPQSLKRSFSEKLVSLVEEHGDISVKVKQDQLFYEEESVFTDKSKEEALAGIFFETGITRFAFTDGLDIPDVHKLLDVFKLYLNSPCHSFDIVAGFWEAQIVGFSFATVEDVALAEYDDKFDYQDYLSRGGADRETGPRTGKSTDEGYQKIFQGHIDLDALEKVDEELSKYKGKIDKSKPASREELLFYAQSFGTTDENFGDGEDEISLAAAEAAEKLGFTDQPLTGSSKPNTALILNDEFVLSEEEEERIHNLVAEDAYFEPFESTVEILKEMLLQETELPGFSETVAICEKIGSEFVQQGRLLEAAQILEHLNEIQEEIGKQHPVWVERLKEALVTAGSRERLSHLRDSLNANQEIGAGILRKYLSNFGW
ncbi:MAG: hypothetical protein P1R58_09690, partial [bacterium]|nr:hypothetical protein [bacterium]